MGNKSKAKSNTLVLEPPPDPVDVADTSGEEAVNEALEFEVLQELGKLDAEATSGDVVLVGDDEADLLTNLDDIQHAVDDYASVDQQLLYLQTHALLFGEGESMPAGQAHALLAELDDAPDLGTVDEFTPVYEAHLAGVEQVPQWKLDQLEAAKTWVAALNDPDLSPAEKFAALQVYADAVHNLQDAAGDEWPGELAALKADTKAFLENQSPAQLRAIAHANEVAHPLLLSGGNPNDVDGKNALAAVLDPAYPDDAPHKAIIAAKATERYKDLQSGAISAYKGVTLDDALADDAAAGISAPADQAADVVVVGPDKLEELKALHHAGYGQPYGVPDSQLLPKKVELAWQAHQAVPVDGVTAEDLAEFPTTVSHTQKWHVEHNPDLLDTYADITGHDAKTIALANQEQFHALLNPATPADEVDKIVAATAKLDAVLTETIQPLSANVEAWQHAKGAKLGDGLSHDDAKALFNSWVNSKDALKEIPTGVPPTLHPEVGDQWVKAIGGKYQSIYHMAGTGAIAPYASDLRAWMKNQSLGPLRSLAAELGMGDAAKPPTTRAQVQNWMIAHAQGKTVSADNWKAVAEAKQAAPPTPKAPTAAPSAGAAASAATKAKAPSVTKPVVTSAQAVGQSIKHVPFAKQLDDLEGLLKQAQGAATDVPSRAEAQVSAAGLVADDTGNVSGGAHTKHGWRDPDTGRRYFAKNYQGSGRLARIMPEVVASEVKEEIGIPTIPCYHHKVNGEDVALQPKIEGAQALTAEPNVKALSQTDIDQIVRNQIGDWLIGDHDAHGENWVRTPSGTLMRCDLGTAWKYAGADKLDLGYTAPQAPTSGKTVFQHVMHAQQNGGLADGVKVNPNVAAGVISKVDKLPPTKFREMLRPVAEAGAASNGTQWRPRMRKAAAQKHGIPESQVTDAQTAEAFLDHAEERRKATRDGFHKLFSDVGLDAAALRYID